MSFLSVCVLAAIVAYWAMMRFATMVVTLTWAVSETGEGTGIGSFVQSTYTGNEILSATITVPISTSNQEFDLPFAAATVQALIITTTFDVTMYTNHASGSTPDDTVTLKAATPWAWLKNSGITFPLTGATGVISKLFFTNASGTNAPVIRIRGLQAL